MQYRNNRKNRDYDKEAAENFCLEQATIALGQGASEDRNSKAKLTPSKTDSYSCFGITRKRIFDIAFSSFFLIALSPLYVFLFFLVKSTSKGPAFYKGLRMGQNGKLFWCLKFRSMTPDADQKLAPLLQENPKFKREWDIYLKLKNDPRRTKVGRFLRKTSLDELPQFWNVLKGDLSVVGPRPIDIRKPEMAREEIQSKYRNRTDKILTMRPGITCLWQLNGRSDLSLEERVAFEEEYVNTQTFWLDLKIICKTVYILLFPKGAY